MFHEFDIADVLVLELEELLIRVFEDVEPEVRGCFDALVVEQDAGELEFLLVVDLDLYAQLVEELRQHLEDLLQRETTVEADAPFVAEKPVAGIELVGLETLDEALVVLRVVEDVAGVVEDGG